MSSDKGSVGSNEVSEVMSPQVSLETMGPQTVTDLPRYHSLVEDFGRLADCWMAAGQLRGPANIGGGYLLDLWIPLSGEEGDVLLGEIARDNEGETDLYDYPEVRPLRYHLKQVVRCSCTLCSATSWDQ